MSLALILDALNAAVTVAQEGTQVYTFLTGIVQRLQAAQATGGDPTPADWAYIDQLSAQNLAQLAGYPSLTAALLAAPKATTSGS